VYNLRQVVCIVTPSIIIYLNADNGKPSHRGNRIKIKNGKFGVNLPLYYSEQRDFQPEVDEPLAQNPRTLAPNA